MRDGNLYGLRRALPRMSWAPQNLFNLWRRSQGPQTPNFTRSKKTLFQQRWTSKALVRAYHGDFINEKIFQRWYLPPTLPDVRPRKGVLGDDSAALRQFAGQNKQAEAELRRKEEENQKGLAPVGSLMFAEVERRIDVFIFRCCFAHSVYEARRLVIHGSVLLNGVKHQNANTRLAPGDMVSVDPSAIRFLRPAPSSPATQGKADAKAGNSAPREHGEQASDENSDDLEFSPSATPSMGYTPHARKPPSLTPFHLPDFAAPFLFIPAYIEVSFMTCSAVYVRHPTARPGYSEIPTPYEADGEVVRLAWEWYVKMRPRMRSKRQLSWKDDGTNRLSEDERRVGV